MNKKWGLPISKNKIVDRRNRLIEYQKTAEVRFTPLYQTIDENILDINYMIYEIERLNNIINELVLSCYGSDMSLAEFENIWEIAFNKKYNPKEIWLPVVKCKCGKKENKQTKGR